MRGSVQNVMEPVKAGCKRPDGIVYQKGEGKCIIIESVLSIIFLVSSVLLLFSISLKPGVLKRKFIFAENWYTMTRLTSAETGLHDQADLLPRRKLIPVLCVLAIPSLISFIDQNGISTALPTIAADLNAQDTISWAGTASLIANTTFTMLYGRLSDIFGRKNIYVAAVALLAFADLMCGLSRNVTMFYIFRGVAGIGGGGIVNLSMIIVSDVVTLEERGKYQGIISSMVGVGSATGPFIAAAFVSQSSWRGFFYMLSPLGALSCVVAWYFLPSKPPTAGFKESMKKVDWLGLLTSSIAVIFLLIPISGGMLVPHLEDDLICVLIVRYRWCVLSMEFAYGYQYVDYWHHFSHCLCHH